MHTFISQINKNNFQGTINKFKSNNDDMKNKKKDLESAIKEKINNNGNGQINGNGDGQINGSGDGQINGSGDGQINGSGDGQINGNGNIQINNNGDGQINGNGNIQINNNGDGQINNNGDGQINGNRNGRTNEQIYLSNEIKKKNSCKAHSERKKHHNSKHKFSKNYFKCRSESFSKNEKSIIHTIFQSEKMVLKDEAILSNKHDINMSNMDNSEDTYKSESYEKFFEIDNEAKHELSEHVRRLVGCRSESNQYVRDAEKRSETDKYSDLSNKKRKKKKRSIRKKKLKKSKITDHDEYDEDQNFNKLKTFYKGAHDVTTHYITKMFNKKISFEKNMVEYDNILSKHGEDLIKKFDIFEEEESLCSSEIGNDFVDNICEYFTYLMFLTLKT
ncbi:conserved Plasmodium protein, unknown function [Plasmodium malariae]|uniref:Uncharacterized protein n=1 Tax=Plasmodium malariae TaxID=5858 RepID=A0A1D3SMV1_PLAMA|nr:conserved Plasmodium protein, unknown function [Plasmodium malariae]SCO93126.1 conserved Plasmodium protein, unknown function [Plasmodium malariae]